MARMMPPYCPTDAPPGEKALFNALASSTATDGWIVLHSLAIASHVRQVQGETDFVIVVPERGVLVVEVKSHSSVKRMDDGRWRLGNQSPTSRGPFQQASEAMQSLRKYMINRGVDLRSVPILDAVWFTHVRARTMLPRSPEWHDWQLLDSEDLRVDAAAAVLRVLTAGGKHLASKIGGFARGGTGPDATTAMRIATILRPKFEAALVHGDIRRGRETQLAAFTDEQYDALDNMQHNRAVLFTGPAGSGKTWLALEAARREAELGHTGRLLCFNRLLGQHLRRETASLTGLRTATFYQEAVRLGGVAVPADADAGFWDRELPDKVIEALLEDGEAEAGDFLIVDEIQDLARESVLDVLDLLVKGGLKSGRVLLFGDFERQAIYEAGDGRGLLRQHIPGLVTCSMAVNCRNLPRIGTVVKKLSRLSPGYRRFRRPDDGVDPEFVLFERGADQSTVLADAVRTLRSDGYGLDEIVVLSPLRNRSAAEVVTDPWLRQILRPADGSAPGPGQLRYTTVHAFKGLDAPAVIITDLDESNVLNFEPLLYIGMTRATDRLTALAESRTLRNSFGASA
ncbi:nuclease-related domain-containing DEAD/DEAH box helicase [Catenulispora rubra]|uniref:nuclease-related domain-containing DEAD/DEAH box helicase n=1 Tax=Catenulispora rubra TaxID=280293 RepID=UPI001E2F6233|nr:NERD domain-containing protein [Catenulispora rubra]